MKLKLLHITPYYLPDTQFGGPAYSVSALCQALVSQGHQVTVYTIGYRQDMVYPLVKSVEGVEIWYFKNEGGRPSQLSRQLWQQLAHTAHKFQVVHLHTWWNLLVFQSLRIIRSKGIPVMVSPRGMLSHYSFTHRKAMLKKCFHRFVGARWLSQCAVHATSPAEADEIVAVMNGKPISVFMAYNLLDLQYSKKRVAYRGNQIVLGFMSRLVPKKGIENLLYAMVELPQISKLQIAGSGDASYLNDLQILAANLNIAHRVQWLGWLGAQQKVDFLDAIDLFILPSYNENFANVVVEAMAANVPVVVSRSVGLSAEIEKNKLGWICDSNVASIVATLQLALTENDQWPQYAARAQVWTQAHMSHRQALTGYELAYSGLINTQS